jgi:hypothetical protein
MSTYLDELFTAGVPELYYAWTYTSVDPSSGEPSVSFATGKLVMTDAPLSRLYYRGPRRYIDSSVKLWQAQGLDLAPTSFPKVPRALWVNQLMIMQTGASYTVQYGNRQNFNTEFGLFVPEVYTGENFPGYPGDKAAILIARVWLGTDTIVLSQPGTFPYGFSGHMQTREHASMLRSHATEKVPSEKNNGRKARKKSATTKA